MEGQFKPSLGWRIWATAKTVWYTIIGFFDENMDRFIRLHSSESFYHRYRRCQYMFWLPLAALVAIVVLLVFSIVVFAIIADLFRLLS